MMSMRIVGQRIAFVSHRETHFSLQLHHTNGRQDLLGKGDQQTAEQAQNALRPLAGIVRLDRHTELHDAPAEDNDANGLDAGEDKIGEVVDDGQRIVACGKGWDG